MYSCGKMFTFPIFDIRLPGQVRLYIEEYQETFEETKY